MTGLICMFALSALACDEAGEPPNHHDTLSTPAESQELQLIHLITRYYDIGEADWERTYVPGQIVLGTSNTIEVQGRGFGPDGCASGGPRTDELQLVIERGGYPIFGMSPIYTEGSGCMFDGAYTLEWAVGMLGLGGAEISPGTAELIIINALGERSIPVSVNFVSEPERRPADEPRHSDQDDTPHPDQDDAPHPDQEDSVDADGDGFFGSGPIADDCDDGDGMVHPHAPERLNGRDDNCNGAIDEDLEAAECSTHHPCPEGMVCMINECDQESCIIDDEGEEQCDSFCVGVCEQAAEGHHLGCGDGVCAPGEDHRNCPSDCDVLGGDAPEAAQGCTHDALNSLMECIGGLPFFNPSCVETTEQMHCLECAEPIMDEAFARCTLCFFNGDGEACQACLCEEGITQELMGCAGQPTHAPCEAFDTPEESPEEGQASDGICTPEELASLPECTEACASELDCIRDCIGHTACVDCLISASLCVQEFCAPCLDAPENESCQACMCESGCAAEAEACTGHAGPPCDPCAAVACEAHHHCVEGECIPVDHTEACERSDTCAEGMFCEHGICAPLPLGACLSGDDLLIPPGGMCSTQSVCADGACVPVPAECDGPLQCDAGETCVEGVCHPTPSGFCISPGGGLIPPGAPCDDLDPCTADDFCNDGLCTGIPSCPEEPEAPSDLPCQQADGSFVAPGEPCEDFDVCTINTTCHDGVCGQGEDICDGTHCFELDGSVVAAGEPCDDGDACTASDFCNDGICVGSPLNCDDGNPCTHDFCENVDMIEGGCANIEVPDCELHGEPSAPEEGGCNDEEFAQLSGCLESCQGMVACEQECFLTSELSETCRPCADDFLSCAFDSERCFEACHEGDEESEACAACICDAECVSAWSACSQMPAPCRETEPEGMPLDHDCDDENPCAEGLSCAPEGVCVEAPEDTPLPGHFGGPCDADTPCHNSFLICGPEGICVNDGCTPDEMAFLEHCRESCGPVLFFETECHFECHLNSGCLAADPCDEETPCIGGLVCGPDNQCAMPSEDEGCAADADCPSNATCNDGLCVAGAPAPQGMNVNQSRELIITDLAVIEDPTRTAAGCSPQEGENPNGVWTFKHLMSEMAGEADPVAFVESWLNEWASATSVNGFDLVPASSLESQVLAPWRERAGGTLDLAFAPFRLLAIVNRFDLRDESPLGTAGEGRFVFGLLDQNCNPTSATLILEYALPAPESADEVHWAQDWHALGDLEAESYRDALEALTRRFTDAGVMPQRANGSAINQVRTNDILFTGRWTLREFHLSEDGLLISAPTKNTPDASFNGSPDVASAFTELGEVPETMFAAESTIDMTWSFGDETDSETRHEIAVNTCNGCHGNETGTNFLHISNRAMGTPAALSGFMTGMDVTDPVSGEVRHMNDLARRQADLEAFLAANPLSAN